MPSHRPGQFAVIGGRAGSHPAVPFGHALIEHEIGRHPTLRVRILPADLLHQTRVVGGLVRPLRKRAGTCAQEDDRRETATRQGRQLCAASDSINAPAIGTAVRSALLIDRQPDTLGKSVCAFRKALDHAPILVGKSDRPPSLVRRRGCRLLRRSLFRRDARQQKTPRQKKPRDDTGQTYEHGFHPEVNAAKSSGYPQA